jgi:hypothetical protein
MEILVQTWEVNAVGACVADRSSANFSLRALPGVRGICQEIRSTSVVSPWWLLFLSSVLCDGVFS